MTDNSGNVVSDQRYYPVIVGLPLYFFTGIPVPAQVVIDFVIAAAFKDDLPSTAEEDVTLYTNETGALDTFQCYGQTYHRNNTLTTQIFRNGELIYDQTQTIQGYCMQR